MARANFAVLAGDGTGPEIIAEAVKVLGALRDRTARTWRLPGRGCAVVHEEDQPFMRLPPELAPRNDAEACAAQAAYVAGPCRRPVDDRDAVYSRLPQEIPTLAADNAWNAGLVLGPAAADWKQVDLGAVQGVARIDGVEVGRGHGRDILGHPLDALAWLAAHLAGRGIGLREGDVVTAGSLVATQFPRPGARVDFEIQGLGAVHCEVR